MRGLMLEPKRLAFGSIEHSNHLSWCLERLRAAAEAKRPVEEQALTAYKNFRAYLNRDKHPFPVAIYDPVFFGTVLAQTASTSDAMFASPPIFDYETDEWDGGDDESTQALQNESDRHLEKLRPWLPVTKGILGTHLVGTQYYDVWWDYQEKVCAKRAESVVEREFVSPVDGSIQRVAIPTIERKLYTEPLYDGPAFAPRHITRAYADTDVEDLQRGEFYARRDEISADEAKAVAKIEGWDRGNTERAIRDTDSDHIRAGLDEMRDTADWLQQIGLDSTQRFATIVQRKRVEVLRFYHRKNGQVLKTVVLNRAVVVFFGPSEFDHGLFPAVKATNYILEGEHFGISDWEIVRWLIQGIQTLRNAGGTEALIATMPVLLKKRGMQVDGARYEPNAFWEVDDVGGIVPLQRGSNGAALGNNEADLLRQVADSALGSGGETGRGNVDKSATATAVNQALNAAGVRGKFRANNTDEQFVIPTATIRAALLNQYSDNPLVMRAKVLATGTAMAAVNADLQQKRWLQLLEIGMHNSPVVKPEELHRATIESIAGREAQKILRSPEEMQQQLMAQQQGSPVPLNGPEGMGAPDPMREQAAEMAGVMAA